MVVFQFRFECQVVHRGDEERREGPHEGDVPDIQLGQIRKPKDNRAHKLYHEVLQGVHREAKQILRPQLAINDHVLPHPKSATRSHRILACLRHVVEKATEKCAGRQV